MADGQVLSDSVQLIAGLVGVAVAAGSIVVGWLRGKGSQPTTEVQAAAGIIDNRGVKALVNSIDAAMESFLENNTREIRARKEMTDIVADLKDEIAALNRNLSRWVVKDK